ncbi:dihydroorotate dehydrogenase [Thioclava sp. A2]|uniref:dihydroorotate dehydrogenase n=1 Tax=Thioclava sp. FCG-A2 TaxID=3080562 RepID=UPI002952B92C|nr:dihydroorotate dehydrogenase [Thioclava sp. A2]MDV7272242.1 dihydroorotate dehydrogenase [Thioclava sp. A2]
MTEHSKEKNFGLDAFFDAARNQPPMPSGDFMARILADAEGVQAGFGTTPVKTEAPGLWASLSALFGGIVGVGGMATAALAGVWIGFAGVGGIDAYWPGAASEATIASVDLMPAGTFLSAALEGN